MAYKAEPKNPRTKRSLLWNVETLKEDLRRGAATLTSICKRYAETPDNWRALYADVQRWKAQDLELADLLEKNREATDSKKRKKVSGGRPRNDTGENADFRLRFCEKLLETKSRNKAALVTPYTPEQIYQMLNENYTSYDKEFAEMVHFTEMRLVAWAEEEIWTALEEAQHPKDRAWIAKEILKVRDRKRWGDKLDVSVQSTHTHTMIDSGKMMAALEEDRRAFFDRTGTMALESENIMEAEVVK